MTATRYACIPRSKKREIAVAIGMILEFDGFTTANYDAVTAHINWPETWPEGLTFHVAGPTDNGMRIVEVWDSREQFDKWVEGTIQPAIGAVAGDAASAGPPPRFTQFEVHRQYAR